MMAGIRSIPSTLTAAPEPFGLAEVTAAAQARHAGIMAVRQSLGPAGPAHPGDRNPMIFFRLGGS